MLSSFSSSAKQSAVAPAKPKMTPWGSRLIFFAFGFTTWADAAKEGLEPITEASRAAERTELQSAMSYNEEKYTA